MDCPAGSLLPHFRKGKRLPQQTDACRDHCGEEQNSTSQEAVRPGAGGKPVSIEMQTHMPRQEEAPGTRKLLLTPHQRTEEQYIEEHMVREGRERSRLRQAGVEGGREGGGRGWRVRRGERRTKERRGEERRGGNEHGNMPGCNCHQ